MSPSSEIKEHIAKNFPDLILRIGRSKIMWLILTFTKIFKPDKKSVDAYLLIFKIRSLSTEKVIRRKTHKKLSSCHGNYFISPVLVTVKEDQTIKLALDSKILIKAIHEDKYQMPNIDTLIKSIFQQISAPAQQNTTHFSTLNLKYAYSQINLEPNTANHCNFNIISGDMTSTYSFQTGFYGLTDMPAEFQKAMNYTLIGLKNIYIDFSWTS